jgi:dolichol-phosphate mannosyltransferase
MKVIDVVLPVYNEEAGILQFHNTLTAVLDSLQDRYIFHLIYIVDRCSDNSFAILKQLAERGERPMSVVHLSRRFGHQMSLVAGLDFSRGDALIMMDCDLQHPPALIPKLLDRFEQGCEVVHTVRQYHQNIGVWKRWPSRLFYTFQNALSPVEIHEGAADFRLITRRVVELFRTSVREQNQFLRGLFEWVGFTSATVPFVSPPRIAGVTKYRLTQLLLFFAIGITSFSKVPLRLAAVLGFAISTISISYALWLILLFYIRGDIPPGYTSLIVVVLFMGGLQLIVLGIIGEYLGGIFDEVKGRPLYIVDEVVSGAGAS